jgi:hypothetical protein
VTNLIENNVLLQYNKVKDKFGGGNMLSLVGSMYQCVIQLPICKGYNVRKILPFPCKFGDLEMFIAWVKKCGIKFEDNRV